MTKSEAAYHLTVDRLFKSTKRVYFWTFTFTEVWDDFVYSRMWNRFWRDFTNVTNLFMAGVKVTELHPGGHGVHYHCLLTARIPVQLVRRLGGRFGIGRVHVRVARAGDKDYLAKYLSKEDDGLAKGIRKWSCIGGFQGVKVSNIEIDSDFIRTLKVVKGREQMTWTGYQVARREYVRTGRVSPQTVMDNLRKKRVPMYEQVLAERMHADSLNDEQWEDEQEVEDWSVVRYFCERDGRNSRYAVFERLGDSLGRLKRGRRIGYCPCESAHNVVAHLNEKLEKNYAV